ncbi:unnamed protein product [Mytilus edulis]|uniref:PHD-type domain-containing protein n=1 Tax=Mytilus edulis TaxID=6550 RepID=A0A8S3T5D1_MYTED|nr:unnamed protein product [Mytilus edulis]
METRTSKKSQSTGNTLNRPKALETKTLKLDLNTSGLQLAEKEDGEICPNCEQAVQTEGIACDSCNNWFHYKCVGLTEDHINSIQQLEYHCDQCNDDLLYVGATFIPQTDENNQELLINTSSSEPAISSHEIQDHPKDICMDSPAQKSSLESPTGTYLNPCITSCHNQSANNSEKEDTMVKSVLTHTSGDSTSSNRNPITDRGKSAKRNISPTSRSSNNQRKSKVKSSDLEHDQTLITQRTRILDLENEVNQLRTVLQTFKDHIKHQSDPAEIGPSHQNSNHSFRIDANPHFNPRHRNDTNSPWSPQHLDTYYKQELLENRLRILENQTAQNMSINTALITQLSLQNRPMGHYHPPFQHNLHQSHYPPQQPVPLLPQWNMHPAYSQTQFSNHPGFMQHQPQPQFQTNSHLATGYPGIPQQNPLPPTYAYSSQQVPDFHGNRAPHMPTPFIPQPHIYHTNAFRTDPGSQHQVSHLQQSSGRHNKVFNQNSTRPAPNSNLQARMAKNIPQAVSMETGQRGWTNRRYQQKNQQPFQPSSNTNIGRMSKPQNETITTSFSSTPIDSEIVNYLNLEIHKEHADIILDPPHSNQFITTAETHHQPIEHSQKSQVSSHQTTYQISATDNIQSPNRTGIIKSNSPFRNNCLQEKPPEQKESLELLVEPRTSD